VPLERVQPEGLHRLPLFTHVVKAGNTVYIAGQVALDADGSIVGPGDISAQTRQAFENFKTALASVGADFTNVAKITIYATDAKYRPAIAAVRREYAGSPDPLASTFVAVSGLALPELLVEIDGVAILD
jgi:enamine deaminase RidA (YjgF/YER057c/UK114 family)